MRIAFESAVRLAGMSRRTMASRAGGGEPQRGVVEQHHELDRRAGFDLRAEILVGDGVRFGHDRRKQGRDQRFEFRLEPRFWICPD